MHATIPNEDYFKPNILIFEKYILFYNYIYIIIIDYIIFACVAIFLPQAGNTLDGGEGGGVTLVFSERASKNMQN